jgi:hypothetical protein
MAQKVSVFLIDDLDGSQAAETIKFALDGIRYEIDLNPEHAEELRRNVAPYAQKARKAPGAGRRQVRTRNTAANGTDSVRIRDWARGRGIKVSERGRIPASVVAEYEAVNSR